ncbi:protein of unknown function DUF303 acetylesterase putative [Pirellula staleyi DSM 6068]|uniref:DUF2341 domain-containing protein n=1 Tax=Pirellula staleyi (strain ATCC 27377 / DSM 6068 / ICPB 4128) TaxID=530564 RepID=D2R456_PIRSD|nr:protein of unknown function DUF303 acetylesterase putative [Pirellula staleyi DSM 6068]
MQYTSAYTLLANPQHAPLPPHFERHSFVQPPRKTPLLRHPLDQVIMPKTLLALLAAILLVSPFFAPTAAALDDAPPPDGQPAVAGHQRKTILGWSLLINDQLLEKQPKETERALELLKLQLEEIVRVVPAASVAELRKVPLWFSPEYAGVQPRAEYHPGAGWLRDNQRNPAMAKGVEFTNIRTFERETKRMPNFALHELAHAYHDRVLDKGFGNVAVKTAFEHAKTKGLYERVERRFGDGRTAEERAYALTSPMEYFAECTEAYFSTNDFFPYTRDQLEKYDPGMVAVLKELWPVDAKDEVSQTPDGAAIGGRAAWKHTGSLWLLTTPEGANLPAEAKVEQFPVLVRLDRDFFNFAEAHPRGDDLRFSLATGEPLAYQIDTWDPAGGSASIWVRVPLVVGKSRQAIKMFWGNPAAQSESNGNAVFQASNGFLSVWHMNDELRDEVGSLSATDKGTTDTAGVIGRARHFADRGGVVGGEMIASYPTDASSHSTEVWFRAEKPNATLIGWGNEQAQGKVVMQFRSPPQVRMDCYFSGGNVATESRLVAEQWNQIVHTYRDGEARIYVNGVLDGVNKSQGSPLKLKSPARLYLGGWYNNFDFVGALDEVRVSQVVRSADWIKLQYENQKPSQTLVGPLVQPGNDFSVSTEKLVVEEGKSATLTLQAGGAQKLYWILDHAGETSVVATDRFTYTFAAGRVVGDETAKLTVQAIYAGEVRKREIPITITESLPEPRFTLEGPKNWNGRETIEVVPQIVNLAELEQRGVGKFAVRWTLEDVAVIGEPSASKLILKRAQGSGPLRVTATIDNGGAKISETVTIAVTEPPRAEEPWIERQLAAEEAPEDGQFIAREHTTSEGKLVYAGTLPEKADAVFVRVFADDQPFATATAIVGADQKYALTVKLKAGLVKYRAEMGLKQGDKERVLHTAKNIVCGDAYLIIGQSNAVATDFGKENPLVASDWVRTFGATSGDPQGARLKQWGNAEARSPEGKLQIGYWGMELGRRLVESEKLPICLINGAVGGTRIDQHQRNADDPTDVSTIYGRLLWRVQQAKLTHGIRAILWHQGENDQGADGPTGGYGYETYRQFFVDLAGSWKQDYPNLQHYYVFQIWPKSCAMGINGSDNRLREVQRTLPRLFSNLSVMSTLGVKPPGGCHFPAAGYAEFARLIHPLVQQNIYAHQPRQVVTPANLQRAYFTGGERQQVVLEFDQPMVWDDALATQLHLAGEPKQVKSGSASGNLVTLQLAAPSKSTTITYLDSASWSPDNLLYGQNGIAALTFCEVPIDAK